MLSAQTLKIVHFPFFRSGKGGGDDDSILGVIRGLKQTIKNLIRGIVDTIFGTIGGAFSGVADLLGLDAILGDSRDGAKKKRHGIHST